MKKLTWAYDFLNPKLSGWKMLLRKLLNKVLNCFVVAAEKVLLWNLLSWNLSLKLLKSIRKKFLVPTVNLYSIKNIDEAIEKSNSLPFGLHAAILTDDINIAMKAAYNLECGGVMINDSTDYRLDSMPFGGVKNSGLGREGIKFALQEMTEPKVICINLKN